MAGGSISEPGVSVIQNFVTASPSIIVPTLPTVVVGPCIQVVDAFDDSGNPQDDAYAGTYRNGFGVISYALPSLLDGALLAGYEDRLRVFLVYGNVTRELNPESGEVTISSGTAGVFTTGAMTFADATATFQQDGVQAGDVVRFDYRGVSIDFEVDTVDSETQLSLVSTGPVSEVSLTGLTYSVIRSPAEFVFDAQAQSFAQVGEDADYLTLTVQATNETYSGSAGDALTYEFVDSTHYVEAADGATGDGIFRSPSGTFGGIAVDAENVPTTDHYIVLKGSAPPTGAGEVLRQILRVVSGTVLTMETGEGVGLAAQAWFLGSLAASGADMVTAGSTTVTAAGATFLTSIPNTGGVPDDVTYIEIEGDGVYEVTNVDSNTQLTLGTAAATSLSGLDYVVLTEVSSHASDGTTGALTDFVSAEGGFSALTSPASKSVNNAETAARAISTVTNDNEIVLASGFAASFSDGAYSVVDTSADLVLSFDPDAEKVTIRVKRTSGLTSNTLNEIEDAITNNANLSYSAVVAGIITAAVDGAGTSTVDGADLPISGSFDGGSDQDNLLLDADLMDSPTPTAKVYVSYRALRLDVTAAATNPTLGEYTSIDDVEERVGPISTENPLALGLYFALLNSPTTPVKGLGVAETSSTKPLGTVAGYASAFEFLEGYDVYTVVPLTQDPSVHSVLQTHVNSMSAPTNKSERIGFFNQDMPAYSKAEVVASGVDGNTGATFTSQVSAEFSASVDFDEAGVQAGDILVVSSTASTADSPDAVNGTVGPVYGIDITGVKPGDNFVLLLNGTQTGVSTNWNSLVDVSFTVYRAGSAISAPSDQAEAIAQIGEGFADRRMFHVWPDEATADVDGTEQIVPGTNVAAGWAGKVGEVAPEQPLTNTQVSGFSGLKHSNGYFSRAQLDRIAGGGTFITVQDSQSAPLRCRHQLSTDVSTIQKRELSITKAVDYLARFLRLGLSKHIGKYNITQQYLDALTTVVQGLLRNAVESGKFADLKLVELAVDDTQPDQVNIKVAATVLYPGNYIVVTIEI